MDKMAHMPAMPMVATASGLPDIIHAPSFVIADGYFPQVVTKSFDYIASYAIF